MKKPIPFGKYYLLERINVGGMAEVFRAKAFGVEGFERLVAIKRILPNIAEDKEFIRMFIDEAKISVQLNHANIAQIFDLGTIDNHYYIALEHVHGRDLRAIFDRCRNQGEAMPVAQACFVIMKVCEGLDYAHNKRDQAGRELGLVHRDVSPQNVLVSFEGEVKIIDFGIAKAAGKGSKTQAGILKGKFGYMSPEQVRGLPVDRRSDIFSCGIVLYELLTGERLFVGESDFSTLEKVRNVEILPPSTYNRRIPDELERIVLKALAKDVEDRYQNAIDLHDELQAFVYTAGEFYSRKDLAAWSKATFAREIEEELARLEQYRTLAAPETRPPQRRRKSRDSQAPRKATMAMPSVVPGGTSPPPIPTAASRGDQMSMSASAESGKGQPNIDWDDDELETAIYDDSKPSASNPAVAGGAVQAVAASSSDEPDLSSLVTTSKGWSNEAAPPSQPPANLAEGSDRSPSPYGMAGPANHGDDYPVLGPPETQAAIPAIGAAPVPNVATGSQEAYDSNYDRFQEPKSRAGMMLAMAASILLIGGGAIAIFFIAKNSGDGEKAASVVAEAAKKPTVESVDGKDGELGDSPTDTPAPVVSSVVDPDTGFDLIVDPADVPVKLDGKEIGKAPLQIRNLTEGDHFVEISAPAGFFNKSVTVKVVRGSAERVVVKLDGMEVIGKFTSEPPGARVTLVSEGRRIGLGKTPTKAKLDPRKRYDVQFKKSGYVSVTRPIEMTGGADVPVAVVLERARVADNAAPRRDPPPNQLRPRDPDPDPPKKVKKRPEPPEGDQVASKGMGTLLLGAKPPCRIYIDGRDTGKRTPQRAIRLKAGKHKVTLVNNEFGIKETFSVKIKAGDTTRAIKDLTSRIQ